MILSIGNDWLLVGITDLPPATTTCPLTLALSPEGRGDSPVLTRPLLGSRPRIGVRGKPRGNDARIETAPGILAGAVFLVASPA